MTDLGSEQDELYYFAKNFNKLKFSNQAYIDSTQKQKSQNEKEIEKLKKDYEKLRNDVNVLKKTCLYVPGRIKSAAGTNESTFYRLKLDEARNRRLKSIQAYKKNNEKYNELKAEAKLIGDDNNPYVKRIKLLENKLDKAMIKYNEAMSIRRTYEQILSRLKEERAGYDNQIAAIQKSLKAKEHDLSEFKLLLQDSKQARMYSELLVNNTEMSKAAFEDHFEQLIQAHKRENLKELQKEKIEERKRRQKQNEVEATLSEEKPQINKDNDLEKKIKEYEEKDKLVRETTGADDINEICQKFSNLIETKENLKNEQKELEKMCKLLKERKENLAKELNEFKYKSQDEITRKEIEEHEKVAEKCLNTCETARQKLKKQSKLFVDISTGIDTIISILSHKTFEEAINNGILNCKNEVKEAEFTKNYSDLVKMVGNNDKDLTEKLIKLNDVLEQIESTCGNLRRQHGFDDEIQKLDRKEENEIENIYIDAQDEPDEDDEYEPEEDLAPEMPNKDEGRKNDFDSMMRPYSSFPSKNKRISISAKDKNY